jgi:hypothetical protein
MVEKSVEVVEGKDHMKTSALGILLLCALAFTGAGCSSLKIVQGSVAPPKWIAEPLLVANCDTNAFIYASGMSTYTMVLEEGINDARHDAIRKIVERVGVAADDIYRTDRTDKQGYTQTDMPNASQVIFNSHKAVNSGNKLESKKTRNPAATHTSQTRLHGMDEVILCYSVWQYGPSMWAKWFYGDTAVRFYDVYVLMRCPKPEFERAMRAELEQDSPSAFQGSEPASSHK